MDLAEQPPQRSPTADPHGELDGETRALVESVEKILAAPAAPGVSPMRDARARASAIFTQFAGPAPARPVAKTDMTIPGGAGAVAVRLYRGAGADSARAPLVVFFHGGGWSVGSLNDYDRLLETIADGGDILIASVDYRLAPEFKFPAALEDALTAIHCLAAQAEQLGADPTRIAVMGDSAGGALAAVAARRLARSAELRLSAQFLLYPMLDVSRPHSDYPSRLAYGEGGYFLLNQAIDGAAAGYLADPAQADDPLVSPLNAKDLGGLAPAFIHVGGCDPLRDECAAYARRLEEANVSVRLEVVDGAIHGFLSFGDLKRARAARARLVEEIRNRFSLPKT